MAKLRKVTSESKPKAFKTELEKQADLYGLNTGAESSKQDYMRLYSFFERSTEGMLLVNRAGEVLLANAECQKLFGKSGDELLRSTLFDLLPLTEQVVREPSAWLNAAATMGLYTTGDSIRNRRSYAIRQVNLEEQGDEHLIQVYIKEVTDLVHQIEYEAEQTAMLLQMLSHSREPFILLDASLTIFEFNDAAARMMHAITGRYMKKGLSYLDYATPGRAKEKGWQVFREVLSGLVVERELQVPSPMGQASMTWLLTYQPLYDAYGEMAGVFIGGIDQTRERNWQALLTERSERLTAWEKQDDVALCLFDADFKIRYAGGSLASWLGIQGKHLEGGSFRKYLPAKSSFLASLEQHFMDSPDNNYQAIWELLRTDKSKLRVEVVAQPFNEAESQAVYLLQIAKADASNVRRQLALALELMASGVLEGSIEAFALFDGAGNMLPQGNWPVPGMPHTTNKPETLHAFLKYLGKQPGVLLQQWEAENKSPMHFKARHENGQHHWGIASKTDEAGTEVVVLVMLDLAARKQVPQLERELVGLEQRVMQLEIENAQWQEAFGLLNEVFDSVSWEFSADSRLFYFLTPADKLLFTKHVKEAGIELLDAYLHPADARAFEKLLFQAPAEGLRYTGWLRVRTEEDEFVNWHYRLTADREKGRWKGIWYRPLESETKLSLEHFLGFSRFLDDIGWGALVLDRNMRLEHASGLAIEWLQLPQGWKSQAFDQLASVKQTRLAAEACGFREPGSLYEFEYFNAHTQRWLFVWIYTTQRIRAIYLQLMK